jgi:hypothetical protein
MTRKDNKIADTDPVNLDSNADQKYAESMQKKTELINQKVDSEDAQNPEFLNADDGASSVDEEQVVNQDNVSEEEIKDLYNAANRMPGKDDLLDQEFLDDQDDDGSPFNEEDDFLGEDLDIDQDEADSNIYDDNE